MTTIKIYDGKEIIEVEVEDEFALEYRAMEHKDRLIERKETRRHQSLDKSIENGFEVKDERADVQAEAEQHEEKDRLHNAIARLEPQQQWLIEQVYFNDRSQTEIAKEFGIDKTSVRDRLQTILKKLKKFL